MTTFNFGTDQGQKTEQVLPVFTAKFSLYTKLNIDGDSDLIVTMTAVVFRSYREPLYEVSWLANGDNKIAWVEEPRLSKAEL